jgi:hypothetical protein
MIVVREYWNMKYLVGFTKVSLFSQTKVYHIFSPNLAIMNESESKWYFECVWTLTGCTWVKKEADRKRLNIKQHGEDES